jgi:hypothetical protein
MKDYVDKFVVCESNRTQKGKPIERGLPQTLVDLGIPSEKFIFANVEIPDDSELEIQEIDKINSYQNHTIDSYRSRARERLQKNALHKVLDQFDDNTFFIVSDCDEIVRASSLKWILDIVDVNMDKIIKIPLVHLEGRANLRVVRADTLMPKLWDNGMFICKKEHLMNAEVIQIRSSINNPYPSAHIGDGNKRFEDLGWHFSWMGDASMRDAKLDGFVHRNEKLDFLETGSYDSDATRERMRQEPEAGQISVSCEANTVLVPFPEKKLPKSIFENDKLRKYFLKETVNKERRSMFKFNEKSHNTMWVVDDFFEDPHAVRNFAMQQEYVEGGFGRGFIGRRSVSQFLFPGMKERFEQIIGRRIVRWEDHGMNGRFQYCYNHEPLVYHCDDQTWAAAIYLTPDAPPETGTTLWRHKKTKIKNQHDPNIVYCFDKGHLEKSAYEAVDVAGNIFNRLVIWDAANIHSASQYCGETKETSRFFQVFFFD